MSSDGDGTLPMCWFNFSFFFILPTRSILQKYRCIKNKHDCLCFPCNRNAWVMYAQQRGLINLTADCVEVSKSKSVYAVTRSMSFNQNVWTLFCIINCISLHNKKQQIKTLHSAFHWAGTVVCERSPTARRSLVHELAVSLKWGRDRIHSPSSLRWCKSKWAQAPR